LRGKGFICIGAGCVLVNLKAWFIEVSFRVRRRERERERERFDVEKRGTSAMQEQSEKGGEPCVWGHCSLPFWSILLDVSIVCPNSDPISGNGAWGWDLVYED
jgi:hypothetical protein